MKQKTTTILVMMDGLRPDAIHEADAPNLHGLIHRSAYSMQAQSVMPSITLPCHTSIFYSVPPERHGVTTNEWQPMARPVNGLVEKAAQSGKHCASFINWEFLRDITRPGNLRFLYFSNSNEDFQSGDQHTADVAAQYIRTQQPDFAFVYFGTVDMAGHNFGWMTPEYIQQIQVVDKALGTVMGALNGNGNILLQADHGGHSRFHGTDSPEDMTIPWMVSGPEIRTNHQLETSISLLDTAPTLARLLGFDPDSAWEGRCVDEVFNHSGHDTD